MTVLITGGAGFIGSALANFLLNLNYSVIIIDDLSKGHRSNVPLDAEFFFGDCSNSGILDSLSGREIDIIYHFAGQSSGERSFLDPDRDLRSNVLSTLAMIAFAKRNNVKRLIYASTMSVYGNGLLPSSENQKVQPLSFYGVGKLASEGYLRIFNGVSTEVSCVRLFNVYGPGQDLNDPMQGMVSIFLSQALRDDKILVKGSLDRFRDFIFINDVVRGFYKLGFETENMPIVVNFCSGKKTTVGELIELIMKELNVRKSVLVSEGTTGDQFGIVGCNNLMLEQNIKMSTDLALGIKLTCDSVADR